MINPQMMGMGQLPDAPSIEQLWKDEKSKYRPFIIMFGFGIIAVLALLIVSFILNVTNISNIKDDIRPNFTDWWTHDNGGVAPVGGQLSHIEDEISRWTTWYIYAYPIISFVLLGIGVLLYLTSVTTSYKTKNFAKISAFSTLIVFMGAMFSVFQLAQLIWSDEARLESSFPGGIFQIVAYSLVIAVAILGSQVSKIKRVFAMSERINALKNDPAYQAAQAQMQQMMNGQMPQGASMGPFGPVVPGATAQGAPASQPVAPVAPVLSKEQEKLEKMSLTDLKKVAKKLSISGSETMEKKEIIEAILRVTNSNK